MITGNLEDYSFAVCMLSLLIKSVNISEWSLKYKYKYNPISSTYMRYVNKKVTWDEAKEGCESEEETLAVFPTLESVIWLNQQLKGPDAGNEG